MKFSNAASLNAIGSRDQFASSHAEHRGYAADPSLTWEAAGGGLERKVQRLLDRDGRQFQSTGQFQIKRLSMSRTLWYRDPFHGILMCRTPALILMSLATYVSFWLIFAIAWWIVAHNADCGVTLTSYRQAFYLSLETMTTIGYGVDDQYFNDCLDAAPVLVFGSFTATLLDTLLLGILILRFGLSTRRNSTVIFTDVALLKVGEDGIVGLHCRVFGMYSQPLLQPSLQMYVVQHQATETGTRVTCTSLPMEVPDMDSTNGPVFLGVPLDIVHTIDKESPLAPPGIDHDPSPEELYDYLQEHPFLEVIYLLGGTVEATGNTAEKRHSYTLDDIFWNREFKQCLLVDTDGMHTVDFHRLHQTVPVVEEKRIRPVHERKPRMAEPTAEPKTIAEPTPTAEPKTTAKLEKNPNKTAI